MASSGHFDPTQAYDGYNTVQVLYPACTEFLVKGKDCFENYIPRSSKCHYFFIGKKPCRCTGKQASNIRRYLWSKKDGPFGKELPVCEAPTLDGSDELDGEEAEVFPNSAGHPCNTSPSQPPAKRFQIPIRPSTLRNFQPTLATILTSIPPVSPHSSHTRDALNPAIRLSSSQQPRNSPIVTSQQLQPVARTIRRREKLSPLPFPASQVFQCRVLWPIQVTIEYPNMVSENQDAVARLCRRVDRYSREVIMYVNDGNVPGTASEEMAAKFAWYEDELILGRDS
ncbi:hypothetical protein O181_015077 [Austropuccinia psidii MF-1]|uniref:Uncharacterized protein n=1 Tax=Austropuccinia psidii MF-1 TaxID=1389203 RepID=A0A9Q3GQF6_9BASI|nr:hypothetical protein [Austropuccinia psidii MF-1]